MYVIGIVSGFTLASLFWLAGTVVLLSRFNKDLWRAWVKGRAYKAVLDDQHEHRRAAWRVKAMDALDEAAR
jgi:hypothetical protein